ncbi:phage portal protein [Corynebacterium sp. MSK004]|uniref:phage portal protein n=1 Tax=Corynebacterium sp. MSK004 TaxID=3050186 RepID=UPI0025503AD8|nr:phage portal protein [Corynebacterium sp. MSK004]MDK8896933.1 phage portal protein [Corynebacterium sp. MSK004]
MLDKRVVGELADKLRSESLRLEQFARVFEANQPVPPVPKEAESEKRSLARLARTPWLRLVVASTAQPLKVSGYRDPEQGVDSAMWRTWLRNDMDSRQVQLNYDVVKYGYGFVTVTPGEDAEGERLATLRPVSPRRMIAEFDDPYMDEYPLRALRQVTDKRWKYFDEEAIYTLEGDMPDFKVTEVVKHDAGVCPVVMFVNHMDLDGNCFGEIEPYMDVAARLDLTTNDRLLVQRYNSWKILYATHIEPPKGTTSQEREAAKLKLRNDTMLMGTGDTQFGTLDETSMAPFIAAADADRNDLSAVTQTPMSMLTGEMINLGADAITNSYRPWREKLKERIALWGDAHARVMRVAAAVQGDAEEARNYDAVIQWEDVEDRSLAQTADAFGKLAQMLEVPPEVLWGRIPGVSQSDVIEWKRLHDEQKRLEMQIEAMTVPTPDMSIQLPEANPETGVKQGERTPASYEDQPKPWGAKRGARMNEVARVRRQRKREMIDGDGDGIVGE